MSRRELVFQTLDNKKVERVPVGFWFHFTPDALFDDSAQNIAKNIQGHQRFFEEFQPDFLKLMSDGYFRYPNETVAALRTAADLDNVTSVNPIEWIDAQVTLVKELTGKFGNQVASFYNVFAPATYLRFWLEESGNGLTLAQLFLENPQGLAHALGQIGEDIAALVKAVITEGGADGIYLSVQNVQKANASKAAYLTYIAPSEKKVLSAANEVSDYNILHICGYKGAQNDISVYADYDAKAVNWAVTVEGVSLREGKQIFADRTVIGGFDNTENSVLYLGTKEEIEAYTENLLREAGTRGVILGADCTVPSDTPLAHLGWVRQRAKEISGR